MKRVRLRQILQHPDYNVQPGGIESFPDAYADELVRSGAGEYVDKPVVVAEVVVKEVDRPVVETTMLEEERETTVSVKMKRGRKKIERG